MNKLFFNKKEIFTPPATYISSACLSSKLCGIGLPSRQSIQHRRDDQVYRCDLGFHYTHFENYQLAHEAAELILTFSRIHF